MTWTNGDLPLTILLHPFQGDVQGNFYSTTQDINPHVVFETYSFESGLSQS